MVESVTPNPLQSSPLVMPRSDEQSVRVRKCTPMVMPQPGRLLSHHSDQSIPEEVPEEVPEEADRPDLSLGLLNNEDGTFVIPKLNKVEPTATKQEFKSKAIKVELKHHSFESNPLETSVEPASSVSLGRAISIVTFRKEKEEKRRKRNINKTAREMTLALVDEIIPEVDLRYICSLFSVIVLSHKISKNS